MFNRVRLKTNSDKLFPKVYYEPDKNQIDRIMVARTIAQTKQSQIDGQSRDVSE